MIRVAFLLALAILFPPSVSAVCCLCDDRCTPPFRGSFKLDQYGKTCFQMALEMANPRNWNQCSANKAKYRRTCCDPTFTPSAVTQTASQPTALDRWGSSLPTGNNPSCDICPGGKFPTANQVLAIIYMSGNPSCKQLWYLAKKGHVPDRVCNPLQDFCIRVCGCPR